MAIHAAAAGGIVPRRKARMLALVGLTVCLASACERKGGLNYPHIAASGRPEHCADRQPMTNDNGIPTPSAVRCSYEDGIGKGSKQLSGRVYGESESGRAEVPLEAVTVTVHKLEGSGSAGDQVGRAQSDPQGGFSMSAMLPAGDYLVIARDADGHELARAPLRTSDNSRAELRVDLLVPLDPTIRDAMRAARGETPTESSPPQSAAEPEEPPEEPPKAQPGLPPARAIELAPRKGAPEASDEAEEN